MSAITHNWQNDLISIADDKKIPILSSFFKTGYGEYGYGDKFIGISVPNNRKIAVKYATIALNEDISVMCQHPIHEFRLSGFLALVRRYKLATTNSDKQDITNVYIKLAKYANNWDLVDLSAPYILGQYIVMTNDVDILYQMSLSTDLWEQRIAIVSTLALIRNMQFNPTINIATKYISHTHPLIHKATGWMLREVGKRDLDTLRNFLDRYAPSMPRTMLRYSIERFPQTLRQHYLNLK
jgi:3-methyladenine DNA glycosylase AlkD